MRMKVDGCIEQGGDGRWRSVVELRRNDGTLKSRWEGRWHESEEEATQQTIEACKCIAERCGGRRPS